MDVDDVGDVLRLVAELAAGFRESAVRKQHLFSGLARIVAADVWVWTWQRVGERESGQLPRLEGGWASEAQKLAWLAGAHDAVATSILQRPLAGRLESPATFARRDLVDDATWYASDFYRRYREPVGLDDLLLSFFPVAPGLQSAIRLHRFADRTAFGARERDLVDVVSRSIDWLHRADVPGGGFPSIEGLSPRQRQVLYLLLEGDGRKQIAVRLRLSQHTVHDYVKALYQHFAVHSQGELLALFIPAAIRPTPKAVAVSPSLAPPSPSWGMPRPGSAPPG